MLNKNITLKVGSDICMFCYTLMVSVKIRRIEYIIGDTNKIMEKEPKEIRNGGYAIMIVDLKKKNINIILVVVILIIIFLKSIWKTDC